MNMTDPIADLLTRIRNAVMVRKESVEVPASSMKEAIVKVLAAEGFIQGYQCVNAGNRGVLKVTLAYLNKREGVIRGLERVSTPGCRVYLGVNEIPSIKNGQGVAVLSTSRGVMSDRNARAQNVGGEILCRVW